MDGGANIYQKTETKVGENFKGKTVILVLDMLNLSCLCDSLVQIVSKSYKHKFRRHDWTEGIILGIAIHG